MASAQVVRPDRLRLPVTTGLLVAALVSGCSSSSGSPATAGATQPLQPSQKVVRDVGLGDTQRVAVASTFGPGTGDVPAEVTVLAFRDHVAPGRKIRPVTPGTHWASAQVRVCRTRPVVLGYPAWVLGDDKGRTAQQSRVLHREFPQPAFPNATRRAGCTRGWVTWVVAAELHPSKVTFEQTRDVPGAWRLR